MVNKVLFWTFMGVATRWWQMGVEMRPALQRETLWAYPFYGGIGAAFGYWLQGVSDRQQQYIYDLRDRLLEKRRRDQELHGAPYIGNERQQKEDSIMATTKDPGPRRY